VNIHWQQYYAFQTPASCSMTVLRISGQKLRGDCRGSTLLKVLRCFIHHMCTFTILRVLFQRVTCPYCSYKLQFMRLINSSFNCVSAWPLRGGMLCWGLRGSLQRLQLDYVDIVFANKSDPRTPMEGLYCKHVASWRVIWRFRRHINTLVNSLLIVIIMTAMMCSSWWQTSLDLPFSLNQMYQSSYQRPVYQWSCYLLCITNLTKWNILKSVTIC